MSQNVDLYHRASDLLLSGWWRVVVKYSILIAPGRSLAMTRILYLYTHNYSNSLAGTDERLEALKMPCVEGVHEMRISCKHRIRSISRVPWTIDGEISLLSSIVDWYVRKIPKTAVEPERNHSSDRIKK